MRETVIEEVKEETKGDVKVVTKQKAATKASKGKVGRKTVEDKKKARQVFFNDTEFDVLEEVFEEFLSLTPKTAMEKAIKDLVKKITGVSFKELVEAKAENENKSIEDIIEEIKSKKEE